MKKASAFLTLLMIAATIWMTPTVPALAYKHHHHRSYYHYRHRCHAKPWAHHHWRYSRYRDNRYYYYY